MEYLAIARKWRPQEFGDLVGQSHVVQTLGNAIRLGRVSHAYLFCGARGVGKTSVARIFAKSLRCANPVDAVACHQCSECQAITESRSVDVVEIDGASNNGVEAVRSLRENVAYGAATGRYKIYIIDEVHMLSLSAFNALLKTLEEPPPYVVFIFATTEVQKIPLTILSRCQRFEFRRLTQRQIMDRIREVLVHEQIQMSDDGVRCLASHAEGSLRDGLSLLDQVLSYFGPTAQREFDEALVVEALGIHGPTEIRSFLAAILQADIPVILKSIETAYMSGMDLKNFTEHVLADLRLVYLVILSRQSKTPLSCEGLDISPQHLEELQRLAQNISLITVERMAQIFVKTIDQLGWATQPRFVLEMAAIRMTKLDRLGEFEELSPSARETEGPPNVVSKTSTKKPMKTIELPCSAVHGQSSTNDPHVLWKNFVDSVMKKRPLLGALLSHASYEIATEGNARTIRLAFQPASFYEKQASDTKSRKDIEDYLKLFFGPNTHFILDNGTKTVRPSLEASRLEEEKKLRLDALNHPSVLKTKEIFQAEVVQVDVQLESSDV